MDSYLALLSLAITVGINVGLFVFAFSRQSDKLTDLAYALSFIVMALSIWLLAPHKTALLGLMVGMVLLWAFRLGGFLVYRIRKSGHDARFDSIRGNFWRFLQFWIGQALVAWVLLLPLLFVASHPVEWTWWSLIGVGVWCTGLVIETCADAQKYAFRAKSQNKNKWIDEGLWHYARHPNYFGEMSVWIGFFVTAAVALSVQWAIVSIVSPLAICITLRYVSGVPPLEAYANRMWSGNSDYKIYRDRTRMFVPVPKKRG